MDSVARRKPKAVASMGEPQPIEPLVEMFRTLRDPRINRTKDYPLEEILFLVVSAVLSGVNHLTDIEKFGNTKIDWLRTVLPFKHGVPSHDTIGRVLAILNPDEFERMFSKWMSGVVEEVEGVIAVDGKTLRRAIARGSRRAMIHMVSAFSSANSMVLGQVKTGEKSNEITAIPRLLELLHLKGAIVTIDAMGCQEEITNVIIEKGGDFTLGVKGNQPTLHQDLIELFEGVDAAPTGVFDSTFETEEVAHGRGEYRRCDVIHASDILTNTLKWRHAKSVVRVTAERFIDDLATTAVRYFISSVSCYDAAAALSHTRSHWSVENKLHWCLDIGFREDECRVYAGNAAENLVIVRHMVLNMLRADTHLTGGIASKRQQASWDDRVRERILASTPR